MGIESNHVVLDLRITQQDYYDPQYGTLLHSYFTCTYTEITVLLLWSISADHVVPI